MGNFDVHISGAAVAVVTVKCSTCGSKANHLLSGIGLGTDVSCATCGHLMLVTPDNMGWIKHRASLLGIELETIPPMHSSVRAAPRPTQS